MAVMSAARPLFHRKAEVRPRSCYVAEVPAAAIAAIRGTGHYGMWAEARPYSALMPAKLITLAHFSDSVATYAPNSVAVKIIGIVPRSASRALMVGFASPALMSRLSRAMISGGVPFGAPTPPMSLPRIPEASRQWSAHPAACQIDCCQLRQAPAAHRCVFAAAMSPSHRIQPALVRRSDRSPWARRRDRGHGLS